MNANGKKPNEAPTIHLQRIDLNILLSKEGA